MGFQLWLYYISIFNNRLGTTVFPICVLIYTLAFLAIPASHVILLFAASPIRHYDRQQVFVDSEIVTSSFDMLEWGHYSRVPSTAAHFDKYSQILENL